MATLKPFECKHCGQKTSNFKETDIKFYQQQYEHSYGRNYPKESKLIDHGSVPVFLCDKCTKLFVKENYLSKARVGLIVCLIAVLFLALAAFGSTGKNNENIAAAKLLCVMAAPGFFFQVYYENLKAKERIDHSTRNLPGASAWGRDQQRSLSYTMAMKTSWLVIGGIAGLSILTSIFMPSAAFRVYAFILLGTASIMFLYYLFSFAGALLKNSANLDETRSEAIKYFFKMDDGIDLWN